MKLKDIYRTCVEAGMEADSRDAAELKVPASLASQEGR